MLGDSKHHYSLTGTLIQIGGLILVLLLGVLTFEATADELLISRGAPAFVVENTNHAKKIKCDRAQLDKLPRTMIAPGTIMVRVTQRDCRGIGGMLVLTETGIWAYTSDSNEEFWGQEVFQKYVLEEGWFDGYTTERYDDFVVVFDNTKAKVVTPSGCGAIILFRKQTYRILETYWRLDLSSPAPRQVLDSVAISLRSGSFRIPDSGTQEADCRRLGEKEFVIVQIPEDAFRLVTIPPDHDIDLKGSTARSTINRIRGRYQQLNRIGVSRFEAGCGIQTQTQDAISRQITANLQLKVGIKVEANASIGAMIQTISTTIIKYSGKERIEKDVYYLIGQRQLEVLEKHRPCDNGSPALNEPAWWNYQLGRQQISTIGPLFKNYPPPPEHVPGTGQIAIDCLAHYYAVKKELISLAPLSDDELDFSISRIASVRNVVPFSPPVMRCG